jgi:hypothetical protein
MFLRFFSQKFEFCKRNQRQEREVLEGFTPASAVNRFCLQREPSGLQKDCSWVSEYVARGRKNSWKKITHREL